MQPLLMGLLALALVVPAARAAQKPEEKPVDKAQTWDALKKEFLGKVQGAKAAAERKEVFAKYGPQFLAFAEKNPKDEGTVEALTYCLAMSRSNDKDRPAAKAAAILKRDHAKGKAIATHLPTLAASFDPTAVDVLRAVMDGNADKKVQAKACKELIESRNQLVELAERIKKEPKLTERIEQELGKDFAKRLQDDVAKHKKDAAELEKTLETKFAGVFPDLRVGKAAPEVAGKDLDGKAVKLSDYKGKIVVIDVWATWCPPCRAMIPHSRKLVERLKDKPFVLVSISADDSVETVKQFIKKEPMPWVHWFNGAGGGIVEAWEVKGFPTIYVLDAKGVIRYKDVRDKDLDEAVNALLKEMEKK